MIKTAKQTSKKKKKNCSEGNRGRLTQEFASAMSNKIAIYTKLTAAGNVNLSQLTATTTAI